jgi:RNA polymerase sigma-70 factor (ECF subfamily)
LGVELRRAKENPILVARSTSINCESVGSTSSSLLARIKAREQDGWQRLVRLYGPLVDFWIRRDELQLADAGDVFQEVFAAVALGIDQFHKDQPGDTFRGWLRTITRHKVTDHHRRAARQPGAIGGSEAHWQFQEIPDPEEASEATSDCGERDALKDLRLRALDLVHGEFEPRSWEAFWRVEIDRQMAKDVAEELGMTPAAVRMAKSRILRRVREELGDLEL